MKEVSEELKEALRKAKISRKIEVHYDPVSIKTRAIITFTANDETFTHEVDVCNGPILDINEVWVDGIHIPAKDITFSGVGTVHPVPPIISPSVAPEGMSEREKEIRADRDFYGISPKDADYLLRVIDVVREDRDRLRRLLNTPETEDFDAAVPLEAAHQVERWGADHDAGKEPSDWFWLLGYLAGKALAAAISGDTEKAKHHCISSAAALRNWHAQLRSGQSRMRPGISEEKQQ